MSYKSFATEAEYNTHIALVRLEALASTPAEQQLRQRATSQRISRKLQEHTAHAKAEGRKISAVQAMAELKKSGDPDFQD